MEVDFRTLAQSLLLRALELLPDWLPGGRLVGREYTCGSIQGGKGDSFKVNTETGKWSEFNGTLRGGDLISLYAAIKNLDQLDAAKELGNIPDSNGHNETPELSPPPFGRPKPSLKHKTFGEPVHDGCYRSPGGEILFFQSRYSKKQFLPWSWSSSKREWVNKLWPAPRPLYNLDHIYAHPDAGIIIVEGERKADLLQTIVSPTYIVTTWPGGVNGWDKAEWNHITGRRVLLWPDADSSHKCKSVTQSKRTGIPLDELLPYHEQPGPRAMLQIAGKLVMMCKEVKILDLGDTQLPDGWDAGNAIEDDKWTWEQFKTFAIKHVKVVTKAEMAVREPAPNDRNQMPVLKTESNDNESAVSGSVFQMWTDLGVALTNSNKFIYNAENITRILARWPIFSKSIWFDEFHRKVLTTFGGKQREWSDIDDTNLMIFLQRELTLTKLTKQLVMDAVLFFAHQNTRNEPRDWLNSLSWDGTPRVDLFFNLCFGAKPTDYTTAASKNFWLSMVARVLQPGCKVDNMVILEGDQGSFKSTALDIIGGDWYTEIKEQITSKDFLQSLQGKVLIEIGELGSFTKAEVEKVKLIVSSRTDRYRASYGRLAADYPRQCIFVGTTNDKEYLKDDTGARRFWPIRLSSVDLDMIKANREQFFAEAVTRFKQGENWWVMPLEQTKIVQESRRQIDEWEHIISDYLFDPKFPRRITDVTDIATQCLNVDKDRLDKATQMRIAKILRRLGYKRETGWSDGKSRKQWTNASVITHIVEQQVSFDVPNYATAVLPPKSGMATDGGQEFR